MLVKIYKRLKLCDFRLNCIIFSILSTYQKIYIGLVKYNLLYI